MKKVISTILLVILFVGSGYVVNAAPEMKSLTNFETNDQHYDLQGIEHSFAKVLNFKTIRKDITAKTILKFVYPKKTDKEFNNASVSIKDCIRYATSIGVNME